jgi:hypothetical protein
MLWLRRGTARAPVAWSLLARELKDADAKEAPPLRASLYLTQFSDEAGRLWAYRKDEPYKALHVRPSEIAFERYYYYSRPLDGGRDDNAIKDFFNPLEGEWSSPEDRRSQPNGPGQEKKVA